ncbi:hypothetical protein TIFTF001_010415 [Ficus carica]|uniref:Peroxidase n=1 Tax=Ficus carica TaxID=3494 RepID=A0AA88D3D9_FICCA|nr:hypothetical protein TIFTF001_010415 [Ficus carica]
MASFSSSLFIIIANLAIFVLLMGSTNAQLSTNFYYKTCPKLFPTVKYAVHSAIVKEARMGASLLRLFFHDCFVNGCDGSILLDDTSKFVGEKTANPNRNSARGFDVVDNIKSAVEAACPGVVSCADILAIASRDSVEILGGLGWDVKLGRRDARRSHTIGQARCTSFRAHIYNESNIANSFAQSRRSNCPRTSGSGDNNLAPLDLQTPTAFDNNYFKNLIQNKGLLHSDQELFNGGSADSIVRAYSNSQSSFNSDFAAAMIKMGDIKPLTGSKGEIRKNCRRVN